MHDITTYVIATKRGRRVCAGRAKPVVDLDLAIAGTGPHEVGAGRAADPPGRPEVGAPPKKSRQYEVPATSGKGQNAARKAKKRDLQVYLYMFIYVKRLPATPLAALFCCCLRSDGFPAAERRRSGCPSGGAAGRNRTVDRGEARPERPYSSSGGTARSRSRPLRHGCEFVWCCSEGQAHARQGRGGTLRFLSFEELYAVAQGSTQEEKTEAMLLEKMKTK